MNQKEKMQAVRERVMAKEFINDDPFWFDLIKQHPEYEEKNGVGIVSFKRKIHPINKLPYLIAVRADETEIDFSWISCVKQKKKTVKNNFDASMREAVADQIQEFKQSEFFKVKTCTECGDNFKSMSHAHVDHHKPLFHDMVSFFVQGWEGKTPIDFDDCTKTNRATFKPEDSEFKQSWQAMHKSVAVLRLICGPCNLKRKKK